MGSWDAGLGINAECGYGVRGSRDGPRYIIER